MEDTVHTLQDQVNAALLGGGWETLNNLVAPDARITGPKGFIIDRDTWIGVHKESGYEQVRLEPSETETHTYDNARIRFDLVDSECTYPPPCGAQRDLWSRPLMPAPPRARPPVPPPGSPACSSTSSAARPCPTSREPQLGDHGKQGNFQAGLT